MKNASIPRTFNRLIMVALISPLIVLGAACGSDTPETTPANNDAGGGGGGGGAGGAGAGSDPAKYGFENGMVDGWESGGTEPDIFTMVTSSPTEKFAGTSSLAATIESSGASVVSYSVEVSVTPPVAMPAGTRVAFHLFVPADAPINWVQPFIQEETTNTFWGAYTGDMSLAKGDWDTIMLTVGDMVVNPIHKMGVQFHTTAAWTGTVYIDSVTW